MGYATGVGREAPGFTIGATDGSVINLKNYRGDWFPVIVFLPEADAGAAEQLRTLSAAALTLWGLRGQLLGVFAGPREDAWALAESIGDLAFPLVPDDGSVAKAYGALKESGDQRPMAFILDRSGKIVWTGEGDAALEPDTLVAAFRAVAR